MSDVRSSTNLRIHFPCICDENRTGSAERAQKTDPNFKAFSRVKIIFVVWPQRSIIELWISCYAPKRNSEAVRFSIFDLARAQPSAERLRRSQFAQHRNRTKSSIAFQSDFSRNAICIGSSPSSYHVRTSHVTVGCVCQFRGFVLLFFSCFCGVSAIGTSASPHVQRFFPLPRSEQQSSTSLASIL